MESVALPPGWHSVPWPTVAPKEKKKTQGGHPAFSALQDASQEAYSGLTSWGSLRESEELDHGGSERDGDRGRFTATTFRAGWINFLLVAVPKQRYQHVVLPICRAEPLAPSGQGAWLSALPDLNEVHSMNLILWLCLGSRADSQSCPTAKTSFQFHPSGRHGLRCLAIMEHNRQPT